MFIGVICLFSLLVIMLANAAGRYLLSKPILWADELNNFLFVWFSFLALSYAMGDDRHMRVTAITNILPRKAKYIVNQLMNLITLFMFGAFVSPTIRLLKNVTYSNIMRIPLKYIYFILPLSFAFMCFHIVNNMLQNLETFVNERETACDLAMSSEGGVDNGTCNFSA